MSQLCYTDEARTVKQFNTIYSYIKLSCQSQHVNQFWKIYRCDNKVESYSIGLSCDRTRPTVQPINHLHRTVYVL